MDPIIEPSGQLSKTRPCCSTACNVIRSETEKVVARASDLIRKKPLPVVAGAVAFGVALGCLIMAERSHESGESFVADSVDDARETISNISDSLGRILSTLKFW
jgi:hypothetical protein